MRKFIFMAAALLGLGFVACGNANKEATDEVEVVEVVNDTTEVEEPTTDSTVNEGEATATPEVVEATTPQTN